MKQYEVTIYNNCAGGKGEGFMLAEKTVSAPDPYTACLRAVAEYLPTTGSGVSIANFRKDHIIISKVVELVPVSRVEKTVIFDAKN